MDLSTLKIWNSSVLFSGVPGEYFLLTVFWIGIPVHKQCRTWPDAAFCGIWTGSALCAYVRLKRVKVKIITVYVDLLLDYPAFSLTDIITSQSKQNPTKKYNMQLIHIVLIAAHYKYNCLWWLTHTSKHSLHFMVSYAYYLTHWYLKVPRKDIRRYQYFEMSVFQILQVGCSRIHKQPTSIQKASFP